MGISMGLITGVGPATSSPKRQMGTINTTGFAIEVQMDGGPRVLELTQNAARELAAELAIYLQGRGSP